VLGDIHGREMGHVGGGGGYSGRGDIRGSVCNVGGGAWARAELWTLTLRC
jgi:hypothetical protein